MEHESDTKEGHYTLMQIQKACSLILNNLDKPAKNLNLKRACEQNCHTTILRENFNFKVSRQNSNFVSKFLERFDLMSFYFIFIKYWWCDRLGHHCPCISGNVHDKPNIKKTYL